MPNCLVCGAGIDEYDSGYYARNMLCIPCYVRKTSEVASVNCTRCGIRIKQDEARKHNSMYYCNYCASELDRQERMQVCPICKKPVESWQKSVKSPSGVLVHTECAASQEKRKIAARCVRCGQETDSYRVTNGGLVVCATCVRRGEEATADHPLLRSMMDRIGAMIG
jgi:formylmethanofuran dehydrogenase subunit E